MGQGELRPFPRESLNVLKECVWLYCVRFPGKRYKISLNLRNVQLLHGRNYMISIRIIGVYRADWA